MPKLPVLSGKKVIAVLEKNGFKVIRQKGSHVSLQKISEKSKFNVVVPLHNELAIGTLMSIIKQTGYSKEEFINLF